MQLHAPPEQAAQVAEHDVRVGHRRALAAAAVAGGAGQRAGALGADAERPGHRHVRDRAAAGADRDDVERGDADAEVVGERARARDGWMRVPIERHVGRRAAHVEAEDVAMARELAEEHGCAHSAGGPREDRLDGSGPGLGGRHQTAVRAHDVEGCIREAVGESAARLGRVPDHRGLNVGVRDRGERSLVLAELRQHVRRGGNGEPAHRVAGDRGGVLLERRPRVAVQERHGQRLDAAPLQILDGGANLVGVDGLRDLTARGRTTTHLTNVPDVDERLRLVPDDPAGDGAGGPRAGDLEDVPETLRHQEADARALALEHRVRRDRRAVQHGPDIAPGSTPARSTASRIPRTTPSAGSRVVGTLASTAGPPSRGMSRTSVNVPPTSTPTRWVTRPRPARVARRAQPCARHARA